MMAVLSKIVLAAEECNTLQAEVRTSGAALIDLEKTAEEKKAARRKADADQESHRKARELAMNNFDAAKAAVYATVFRFPAF